MFELFHAISDAESAQVRRFVVEHDLTAQLTFRNVHYPEAKAALLERGGTAPPALWDGTTLISGAEAVIAKLSTLKK